MTYLTCPHTFVSGDAKVLGQDVLADVPSDDDDDDSDDMVFDMSDAKVPQTYNLRLNINTGYVFLQQ